MLTSFLQSQKTIVFSKSSDIPLGIFFDCIIDPDSGKFEALWIRTPTGLKIISLTDIIRWQQKRIIISDEQDITDAEYFPRIQNVLDREVPIFKTKVFIRKKCVGQVVDFSFDTISPRILTLIVRHGLWIWGKEYIIPRSRILKISSEGIFISENIIRTSEKKEKEKIVPVPE
jgi:sporulation protein YlmC with PRC-barrel domain